MFENLIRRIFRLGDYRRFLLRELPPGSVGCEVGVWKGDFSEEIVNIVRPSKLYLVDPWAYQPEFSGSWYGGSVAKNQEDMDAIHDAVASRFSACDSVVLVRKKTEDLSDQIADDTLDWVYVDGNHEYEFVLNDLRIFNRKVKSGGLICGDDYGRGKGAPITRAVSTFLEEGSCEMRWIRKFQFCLQKK